MTIFKINPTPAFREGYIFIERPHQGPRKVWCARDAEDLIRIGGAIAESSRADLSDFDMASVEGIVDFVRHDLSSLTVVRFGDLTADDLDDPNSDFVRALLSLEWVKPEVDEA
jgi:hypothetical protein